VYSLIGIGGERVNCSSVHISSSFERLDIEDWAIAWLKWSRRWAVAVSSLSPLLFSAVISACRWILIYSLSSARRVSRRFFLRRGALSTLLGVWRNWIIKSRSLEARSRSWPVTYWKWPPSDVADDVTDAWTTSGRRSQSLKPLSRPERRPPSFFLLRCTDRLDCQTFNRQFLEHC